MSCQRCATSAATPLAHFAPSYGSGPLLLKPNRHPAGVGSLELTTKANVCLHDTDRARPNPALELSSTDQESLATSGRLLACLLGELTVLA